MPGRSKESKTIVPGIALRLRTLIWKGELQPGEHLNQEAWASALGVSHIPFREAIRILEGEGLLKITANRGVTVTPVTAQEVQEWSLEFRGLMYALLPLAVRHATPASLARARALLPELDQPMVAPETHLEFWRSLFEPCGMPRLMGLLDQLIWRLGRYFIADGKALMAAMREVRPNRVDFLDALEAGDADGALQAWLTFFQVRAEAYLRQLAEGRQAPGGG